MRAVFLLYLPRIVMPGLSIATSLASSPAGPVEDFSGPNEKINLGGHTNA
jgi:hypothetical protein